MNPSSDQTLTRRRFIRRSLDAATGIAAMGAGLDLGLPTAHADAPLPTAAVGNPIAYVHPGGTQHVCYIGRDYHIHELWWDGTWHHNNLTDAAGAPGNIPAGNISYHGSLAGYADPVDGTQHVFYATDAGATDSAVRELWWDGTWHHNNLTDAAGAGNYESLAPTESGVTAYVNPFDGSQHVVYPNQYQEIVELWWDGHWHANNLSSAAGVDVRYNQAVWKQVQLEPGLVRSYVHPKDGTQHVFYIGEDFRLHELWSENGVWRYSDITLRPYDPPGYVPPPGSVDVPAPADGYDVLGPFAAYVNADGTQHLTFVGYVCNQCTGAGTPSDGHVYEVWWDGDWHYSVDLTQAAAAPAGTLPESGLLGFGEPNDVQHVFYTQQSGDIHELSWNGAWHYERVQHVVKLSSKAPPARPSELAGYAHPDGTLHIFWREGYQIFERWFDGAWHLNNLSKAAGL
jgi:hypothetical protein